MDGRTDGRMDGTQYSILVANYTLRYTVQPIAARLQTVQHVTVLNTVGSCNRMVL
jgi:hypothetical protein